MGFSIDELVERLREREARSWDLDICATAAVRERGVEVVVDGREVVEEVRRRDLVGGSEEEGEGRWPKLSRRWWNLRF